MNRSLSRIAFVGLILFLVAPFVPRAAESATGTAAPKVVSLEPSGKNYTPVITGPPESFKMRSGLVVLSPGKSVGKHSTERNEELLVVLDGQGEMTFRDGSKLPVKANSAVYCPPETEHNVTNTGTGVLRYVYVVSNAK